MIFPTASGSPNPNPITASSWDTFLGGLQSLGLDYARHKLIDVEQFGDDASIPDQADLRYGVFAQPVVGGLTIGGVLLLVGVLVGGVWLVGRMT